MNLEQHLNSADPDVRKVILVIAEKAKEIKQAFLDKIGASGTVNVYGEEQDELEKFADQILIQGMKDSGVVRTIASEEQDAAIETGTGELGVVFDPLDGSSCIKTNCSVGTIAGIFRGPVFGDGKIIGALYVMYGPLTTLIYSAGKGVHQFILRDGEFVLSKESMVIPEGKLTARGGLGKDFIPEHAEVMDRLESEGFKIRYTGSFAADFNQVLEYGGFYSYPRLEGKPDGKLRLLFEAYPMAFIVTQAGGKATDGERDILDIRPEKVDQRVPLYIGSKDVVGSIKVPRR